MTIVCVVPGTAGAITNGQPDEGRHPYVGGLVSHDGKDRKHHLICSGTLVSPTVFVTAAHCLAGEPSNLYVSFDAFVGAPNVGPEVTLHPGTAIAHPDFVDETAPGDTHDVAVIELDPPVTNVVPAELAPVGTLPVDGYELVGYGREGRSQQGFFGGGGRRFAFGAFSALEDFKLVLDQSGTIGGTCNGDSGGPVLQRDTNTLLALTSDGDPDCAVNGIYYRLDTASARDFLEGYVHIPEPDPVTPVDPETPGPPPTAPPSWAPGAPPRVSAVVRSRTRSYRRGSRIRMLRVSELPTGAVVEVRCRAPKTKPRGCPFVRRSGRGGASVELRSHFRRRVLPRGTVLQVRVFAPGASAQLVRLTVGRHGLRRG